MSLIRDAHRDLTQTPMLMVWEVTRACALACMHCRAEAIPRRDPRELRTDEGFRVIDEIAVFGSPPPILILTGGDPFERADLEELIAHASAKGLPVAVSPSATPLVTAGRLASVRAAGASALSLSLDGSTAARHDGFRGVDGVFDQTLKVWSRAREIGLKVQINTTVSRQTFDDLVDILRLVLTHGVMTWSVFFLVPTGRGAAMDMLTPREAEDVLNLLYDAASIVSLKTTEAPAYRRVVVQRAILEAEGADHVRALGLSRDYLRWRQKLQPLLDDAPARTRSGPRRPPLDIRAADGFVFVSHVGDVCPSGFLPSAAGNVREHSLVNLYRTSPSFRRLRDTGQLAGRCGACEFRSICGGSRARAATVTGDAFAPEPWCDYRPRSFGRIPEIRAALGGRYPGGGPITGP